MAKILYVEDYPIIQKIYSDVLTKEGFDVDVVGTGEEAQNKLTNTKYDLVVLDLLLPKVSGLEFLHSLRDKGNDQKVVILSDFDNPETVQESQELGVKYFLLKVENTPHVLAEKLHKIIKGEDLDEKEPTT